MATVGAVLERLKNVNKNYQLTAMFFMQSEVREIVLFPDHKVAILTDIAAGVVERLGPWQGVKLDEGVELDGRNYIVLRVQGEERNVKEQTN